MPDSRSEPRLRDSRATVRYELRYDQLEDEPYRIERVEVLGYFPTREAAKQFMLERGDEAKRAAGRV